MTFLVRPIESQDLSQAAELLFRSWAGVFSAWIPAQEVARANPEAALKSWTQIISQGSPFNGLGAFADDVLVGTVIWGRPREDKSFEAELGSMLVNPDSFRKGIGHALMQATIADMRMKKIANFYLNCIDGNLRALRFYEKEGGRRLSGSVARDGYRELRYYWNL